MKNKFTITITAAFLLVLFMQFANGQSVHLQKADELFNRLAYSEAIPEYEKALNKNPDLTTAKIKLADCYRLTGGSEKAAYWYGQIVSSKEATALHKFYYIQALLNTQNYELAKAFMKDYQAEHPDDKRIMFFLKTIDNMPVYFKDSASYTISKPAINSPNADFSPVLFNQGMVFVSARETGLKNKPKHEWTGQPYLNLYFAKQKNNAFYDVEPFATSVQVKYNDGPVCFNKAGDEIYITRNNMEGGKLFKSSDQEVKLKIFHAVKENNTWRETNVFKYNSENYSCAHPVLSPDGNQLFFASDMPGGYGGMDLYMCRKDTGGWSQPKNMGEKINTTGNELFPYLHDDGTFVFSSNGRDGLGGLDVFWCKMEQGDISTDAKNMGSPVNSSEDDFGVVFDNETHFGYFSSNRELKNVNDDIYRFKRALRLNGVVVEKGTDKPIADSRVVLKSKNGVDLEVRSKEDGTFVFPIECGNEYVVEAGKEMWSVDTTSVNTVNYFPVEDLFAKLQLVKKPQVKTYQLIVHVIDKETRKPISEAVIGLDQTDKTLGYTDQRGTWKQPLLPNTNLHLVITKDGYQTKVIYMSNEGQPKEKDYEFTVELLKGEDIGPYARWYKIIYFDFDKSNVRDPDATKTMEEVLQFVREHTDARLLMNSYCDARGTVQYNMKLSKRRAEGATNWLVKNGIDKKIVEKMDWGGESMLINKCSDGSLCSEEDHQLNRRTEIRVIRVERGMSMKK